MLNSYSARREQLRAWANHDALIYRDFTEAVERVTGTPVSALRVLDLSGAEQRPRTDVMLVSKTGGYCGHPRQSTHDSGSSGGRAV
jgi:hypothetical protein